MKARPILMSAPMVEALLEGTKTQTRRIVKHKKQCFTDWVFSHLYTKPDNFLQIAMQKLGLTYSFACPYGKPGDLLYVRESGIIGKLAAKSDKEGLFRHDVPATSKTGYYWIESTRATGASYNVAGCSRKAALSHAKVCASIHMPRWASRLTMEITDIRVERLQDISEQDAITEGIKEERVIVGAHCAGGRHAEIMGNRFFYDGCIDEGYEAAVDAYAALWESINGKDSWNVNPWVWAISFRVHKQNVDQFIKEKTNGN